MVILSKSMILDAIIGLFVSLLTPLAEGVMIVFVPLVNLIASGIEAVVGVFVSGFSVGRIERKEHQQQTASSSFFTVLPLLILFGMIGYFVVAPRVLNRKVTLVAKDGHSLPFAALIIHTKDGDLHERTDNAGNIVIPRYGIKALTIKDPRYVEETWKNAEIKSELTVGRTVLGAGLDAMADRLLKPAKE